MARSFYSHIKEAWKTPKEGKLAELQWQRKQEWRNQGAIERIERPTRLDKARELGYKAKQGIIVVRVSVRKGGARKQRHKAGRRTKRQGVTASAAASPSRASPRSAPPAPPEPARAELLRRRTGRPPEVAGSHPRRPRAPGHPERRRPQLDLRDDHAGRAFRGLTDAGRRNRGLAARARVAKRPARRCAQRRQVK